MPNLMYVCQGIRTILPVGELLTPVLKYLVKSVSVFQSPLAKKMRFYRETTGFVNALRDDYDFTLIHLAGHSLGGGVAIITGAQTKSPTVALSGVNAMITRLTFDPQITPKELNTYIFNIVPDRDPIARIDDLADLYQRVRCTAPANDPFSCHSSVRTVCELMYQCGSAERPPPCECHTQYLYPEPKPTGNRTFDVACQNAGRRWRP
jgi:lipase ATG15